MSGPNISKDQGRSPVLTAASYATTLSPSALRDELDLLRHRGALAAHTQQEFPLPINFKDLYDRSRKAARAEVVRAVRDGIARPCQGPPVDLSSCIVDGCTVAGPTRSSPSANDDAYAFIRSSNIAVVAIADGIGQVPLSRFGSRFLVNEGTRIAAEVFEGAKTLLDPNLLGVFHARMYEAAWGYAAAAGLSGSIAQSVFLASTLQVAIATSREYMLISLGDGYVGQPSRFDSVEKLSARDQTLANSGNPPTLGMLFVEDTHGDVVRQQIREHFAPEGRLKVEHELAVMTAAFDEARSFKVVGYGATASVQGAYLAMMSDGARFCAPSGAPHSGQQRLDLQALIDRVSLDNVPAIVELWNIAAIDTDTSPDRWSLAALKEQLRSMANIELPNNAKLEPILDDLSVALIRIPKG